MRAETSTSVRLMLLRAPVAMAFVVAPFHIVNHQDGAGFELASAFAKDGSSGGGSSGSGHGGGSSGSGHSSGDDGRDDHSGPGNRGDRADNDDRDDDNDRDEHFNPATGARVEIQGNEIEVVFADGTKEEIEAGRFERKNALGRTIVERPATEADFARLRAAAR